MRKKGIFLASLILLGSVLISPLVVSASANGEATTNDVTAQMRLAYKEKKFFKSKPPKKHGKLTLVKSEKVNGGYYGYYN